MGELAEVVEPANLFPRIPTRLLCPIKPERAPGIRIKVPLDDLANPRIKPCPRLCCSAVGHRTLRTHELAILSLEVPRPGRLGEALGAIMGGRLESIWVKRARRGPMDEAVRVELQAGLGIVGNADQGGWRQVTLLDTATWDEVVEAMAIPSTPLSAALTSWYQACGWLTLEGWCCG